MIPVHVVTGFLGVGKTTLLSGLLRAPELSQAMVIVNEWGEAGLDHLLVERLDGDVMLLASGCLCCSLRGDLADALHDLLTRRDAGSIPPFDRIVVETSGLADPGPILHALMGDAFLDARLALANVVTLIDAVNGSDTLRRHKESARQVALADILAMTKSDLLRAEERVARLAALRVALGDLNPAAPIFDVAAGELGLAEFLRERAGDLQTAVAPSAIGHSADLQSFAFRSAEPIADADLGSFLALLRASLGPKLLRIKGLVALIDRPKQPLVIQGAQHVLHAPRRLAAWPDGDPTTRIVVIGQGIERAAIDRLWGALGRRPEIDAPDLEALVRNPLAARAGGLLDS